MKSLKLFMLFDVKVYKVNNILIRDTDNIVVINMLEILVDVARCSLAVISVSFEKTVL